MAKSTRTQGSKVFEVVFVILVIIGFILFTGYSVLKSAGDYFTSRQELIEQ